MKVIDNGLVNFKTLIEEDKFYIDKTLFIRDFLLKSSEVSLITRPRKFGKTLNLDMLEYFLDIKEDSNFVFSRLEIGRHKEIRDQHLNKYPIIRLNFQDISIKDGIEGFKASLYSLISRSYRNFAKEMEKVKMDEVTHYDFTAIYTNNITPTLADESLLLLTKLVYEAYQIKPIILIDDYDKPLERAYEAGFYQEASVIMMDFLGKGLRANKFINKALLMGCSLVAQIGMISNLNNFSIHSIRKDDAFSQHFGFTELEVSTALAQYKINDALPELKKWYGGYSFGGEHIYNPWSITKYLRKREFDLYWVYTGRLDHIKESLLSINYVLLFEKLVSEIPLKSPFKPLITYDKNTLEEGEVLSLLYQAGYLKHVDEEDYYIVNEEVRVNLKDTFMSILGKDSKFPKFLTNFFKNLTELKLANAEMDFTYAIKGKPHTNDENIHYAILSTMQNFVADSYIFTRENPTVRGKYDTILRSTLNKNNAYIIEIKSDSATSEKEVSERLDELIFDGMTQIERRKFEDNLKEEGFKTIHKVVIAVCNKRVRIRFRKQELPEYKNIQKFLVDSRTTKKTATKKKASSVKKPATTKKTTTTTRRLVKVKKPENQTESG